MKDISIKELNSIICSSGILSGTTIKHGLNVYKIHEIHKNDNNDGKWISYLPYEIYKYNSTNYDNSPVGWYSLLRIA